MTYGELLKILRNKRKMTQSELTSEISSQTALSRMEKGDDIPFNLLINFLRRLNIRAIEFFAMAQEIKMVSDIDNFLLTNKVENCSESEIERAVENEMKLFKKTGLIKHQLNSFCIRALYCKIHQLIMVENVDAVKKYLLTLDSWAINDISLYINLLFVFENDFIRAQHRRILKVLTNSPLEKARKHFYEITYANNSVILAFERNNLRDLDLYLANYQKCLSNNLNLLSEHIRYTIFTRLKKLMVDFNQADYQKLLNEINSFSNYGLDLVVEDAIKFVNTSLAPFLG